MTITGTQPTYGQLISQTFCDNSIRSVMMIDDDFMTYSELINYHSTPQDISPIKIDASNRAASLEIFFKNKNILCDIDNGAENFNKELIRKSDLIIIDYHLEHQNPTKTIEILSQLSNSSNLNLVVIYTRENLMTSWFQVACSLRGNSFLNILSEHEENDEFMSIWQSEIEDLMLTEALLSEEQIYEYIINNKTSSEIKSRLRKNDNINNNYIEPLTHAIYEYQISKYSFIDCPHSDKNMSGSNKEMKWIQFNNLFISFHSKSDESDDANSIWTNLNNSLSDWNPSYYRLIKSEIQNIISSSSFSFDEILENDIYGQAAWLNEVIKYDNGINNKTSDVFKSVTEDLYMKLFQDKKMKDFMINVFKSIKNSIPAEKNSIEFCIENFKLNNKKQQGNRTFHCDMYHALNMSISSRNYDEEHISTGTVFFDENNNNWYLCVSASCDMVPEQMNTAYNRRLRPHRLIKVIKLHHVEPEIAITNAIESQYIYAFNKNKRIYLSILGIGKRQPIIDYMVVLNHSSNNDQHYANVALINSTETGITSSNIRMKLKSQLKAEYAARYQNIASQHTGRIGVNYISCTN